MNKAVTVGSFDPVTIGHMWIFETAARMFDEFVIVIGTNPDKHYKYNQKDRQELIQKACDNIGLKNVTIATIGTEFICDYAESIGANFIVKGLRDATDLDYEKKQLRANTDMNPEIATVFLVSPANLEYISSSFVKGFIGYKNWEEKIGRYLPDHVKDFMIEFEKNKKV